MTLVGSVLFGADHLVVPFVQSRIPYMTEGFGPCVTLGVVHRDCLIGGVVYHQYRPDDGDVMVSIAFDHWLWCKPATLHALFFHPFVTLGCERITAVIARKNKRCRKVTEHLGFKLEGVARRAFARSQDAMLYGLLKEECRFLDGQKLSPTSRAA